MEQKEKFKEVEPTLMEIEQSKGDSEVAVNNNKVFSVSENTETNLQRFEGMNTMEVQLEYARMLINSKALPVQYKNPEAVVMAINYGKELGFKAITSILNLFFINGRPCLSTQAMCAMLLSKGVVHKTLEDSVKVKKEDGSDFLYEGQVARRTTIRFYRRHPLLGVVIDETISYTDTEAKLAGIYANVWLKFPKLMLWYRTYAFGARRFAPDILSNLSTIEEMLEMDKDNPITYELDNNGNLKLIEKSK